MDIGITALVPEALWANITHPVKGSREGAAQMEKMVMGIVGRPNVTMEAWTQYDLTLSIDGFGPPWRLPRQLLGMTPIVKVESPLKEFFASKLKPGVHYEPVAYDLKDLPQRSWQLLAEIESGSQRLQRMAEAARDMAVDSFHALAQLDTLAWSLMHVKSVCQWPVEDPGAIQPGKPHHLRWHRVRLSRHHAWASPLLSLRKHSIQAYHRDTFL
ncbi:uncharacterized protein HaLaN_23355 [Haematococcus lacustris]|uniref:Uncharacterized protein n=1 Tax=Haematococcus lacustris TaxID=44745 RepID=A0A699ZRX7_HAELA|nr:uncharacterized protein HaLaN_23355 [Haematococcus lacustris]